MRVKYLLVCMICVGMAHGENLTMDSEDFNFAFEYFGASPYGERLDIVYSQNAEDIDAINDLLMSYQFTRDYEIYEFDCADMSAITQRVLIEAGYDAKLALSHPNDPLSHLWVLVRVSDGWVGVDPAGRPPYLGAVYTRYEKWIHSPKNCIIFDSPYELKTWYPRLEFAACEVVPV